MSKTSFLIKGSDDRLVVMFLERVAHLRFLKSFKFLVDKVKLLFSIILRFNRGL